MSLTRSSKKKPECRCKRCDAPAAVKKKRRPVVNLQAVKSARTSLMDDLDSIRGLRGIASAMRMVLEQRRIDKRKRETISEHVAILQRCADRLEYLVRQR